MKRVAPAIVLVTAVATARAEEARPVPPAAPAEINYSHKGQVMASARVGLGMRAIVPYEETTFCGDTSNQTTTGFAAACTGRAPFSLDLEFGYGVASRIDVFLELRIGIEADFDGTPTGDDGPRPFHLSPGARFFWGETDKVKVFTTAQIVLDLAGYKSNTGVEVGNDFGLRNLSGVWFDLDRAYGFYLYAGPTASFARWFRFELEAGIGLQGRYR